MKNIYKIVKTFLFVAAGVLTLIFAHGFVDNNGENINLYVGIVIAFFGLESAVLMIVEKKVKKEPTKFLNAVINVLLSIVMIFLIEGKTLEVRIACTIWCIWSIMREGEDIVEKVLNNMKIHPIFSAINFVESVVVIIFSILLLTVEPQGLIADALKHVYLLGVELILDVLCPHLGWLEEKMFKKETK